MTKISGVLTRTKRDFQNLYYLWTSRTSDSQVTRQIFRVFWRRTAWMRFTKSRRRLGLHRDEMVSILTAGRRVTPRVFNLDLHIGVIADLAQEFNDRKIQLTQWSISGSNHLVQGRLAVSDPVRFVNQKHWRQLNPELIDRFQSRYSRFLTTFDGFVCTYSPTFAELFGVFGKPILAVAATRYEAPYTSRPADWARFNDFLRSGVKREQILIAANNLGDADYITYFTGLKPTVVPSLCQKPSFRNAPSEKRFVLGGGPNLGRTIETSSGGRYRRLVSPYKWELLASCAEVLVFPQNISTMTLFELATAGVPVAVPSRSWIRRLREAGHNVLAECTFYELEKLPIDELSEDNPNNYCSPKYLDWWLDRADFYDRSLMPNVRIVDSIDELIGDHSLNLDTENKFGREAAMKVRNSRLRLQRQALVQEFINRF